MTHMEAHVTTISQSSKATHAPPARGLPNAARYYGGWRGLLTLAVIAALVGIGLSWNWLVATGIAPFLLATLPCLVMCGLGLCMNKLFGRSCASEPPGSKTAEPMRSEAATNVAGTEPFQQKEG